MVKNILIRMCRIKKRRIRKKWLKNPRNYRTVPDLQFLQFNDHIICHPVVAHTIRDFIQQIKSVVETSTEQEARAFLGF